MTLPVFSELRRRAEDSLSRAPRHRQIVLLSAGVTALLTLAVSAINLLLDQGIAGTGGLGGLGMRSALSTIQSLLSLSMTVLLPFWSLGYTFATLRMAKEEPAAPANLLGGFARFLPALRLFLLEQLLFIGIALGCLSFGSTLLSFTPLANRFYDTVIPVVMEGGDPYAIDPMVLLRSMIPIFLGCLVLFAVLAIPLFYRLRLASYALLDDPKAGARRAIVKSFRMTKGNAMALFRVDLHFWWFYALELVLTALAYGDLLLPALGIQMNTTVAYFLFYVLSLAAQLGLYLWQKNNLCVTYAHTYLSLLPSKDN